MSPITPRKKPYAALTQHKPVLLKETLDLLALQPDDIVLDGTFGGGGHAMEILKRIGPDGKLIGLDQDASALERFRLSHEMPPQLILRHANFSQTDKVLKTLKISSLNAILLDIGLSSDQLEEGERGFSFERPGPLDMRMNQTETVTAADILNGYSARDLENLFREHGEMRFARRIAEEIVKVRPLSTTSELVKAVERGIPEAMSRERGKRPAWARRHPATKIFQAIRVTVNQELEILKKSLPILFKRLKSRGKMAIISFHSSEDRIVKRTFLEWTQSEQALRITRKPVIAQREESLSNPRARSAKLRVVEKR